MNSLDASPDRCAQELLDALPPIMRVVRRSMRGQKRGLSVPQFRTLALLRAAPSANLSAVADILNSSLPTASRVVSGLVARRLVERHECPSDRRQLELVLTARGAAVVDTARQAAGGKLAMALAALPEVDRKCLVHALRTLRGVFVPGLRAICGIGDEPDGNGHGEARSTANSVSARTRAVRESRASARGARRRGAVGVPERN